MATRESLRQARGALPEAAYVMAYGYDGEWTTNLPLADFLAEDALVAFHHDGQPITAEHGGSSALDRAAATRLEKRQVARGH